jgi:hypothetical protein
VYDGPAQESCSNYFIPSYTPTIKALQTARNTYVPTPRSTAKLLLAAVPEPFKWSKLPCTIDEVASVNQVVGTDVILPMAAHMDCTTGPIAGATVQSILDNVHNATILHLACHGHQVSFLQYALCGCPLTFVITGPH